MVLLGVAAAFIVFFVTSKWWAEGFIGGLDLFTLNVIFGGMAFGVFAMAGTVAGIFVLIILLGTTVWMIAQFIKGGSRRYYRDQIKTYEKMIQDDPRNLASRSGMATAYYALGDLDSAIATMERSVQISPNSTQETYQLKKWLQERELRDSKTIVCENCHCKNLWGEVRCRTCGQPIVYPTKQTKSKSGDAQTPIAKIAVGVIWVIVALLAFALAPRPQAALVVVCCTFASIGWLLLSSKGK